MKWTISWMGQLAMASVLAVSCAAAQAAASIIDCPLRDQPYSVDTPMMDLIINPAAREVLGKEAPELMKKIPPVFLSAEAPSLSAIMTLRGATALLRMPMDSAGIQQLNAALESVAITDEDRNARCARYDNDIPELKLGDASKQILIFDKFNGYGHGEATDAATVAIKALASEAGWGVTVTNRGGAFTPEILSEFDVVVWNNVSGDVLTLSQRAAFEQYMHQGGGFLGIHGSGGDFIYLWDWYVNELLGAQFIGHTMDPHYQDAKVVIEKSSSGIGAGLAADWVMNDEWYSFEENPRDNGAGIVATVDESTYTPEMSGISLRMGDDHPIAWTRCTGNGRAFYTAVGHRPEVYQDEQNIALLKNALLWTVGAGSANCAQP